MRNPYQISNQQQVKIAFLHSNNAPAIDKNYFDMIKNRFFPNFQLISLSTLIILLNIIIFIIIHILFTPSKFQSFLQFPHQTDKLLLDIELIKSNRKHIYQIFTSIFMHSTYLHLMGNVIFSMFIMYQMEYCYKFSILWGLLGGVAAQCLAVVSLQGRYLGFSGVLCCYFGMFMGTIFTHCAYLQERYRYNFWMIVIMVLFMGFMLVGFGQAALVHLYGFTFGILLGVAVYPKMEGSQLSGFVDNLFKALAFGSIFLVILLAVII